MEYSPLLAYLSVTSITPGPSNLTALYLGAERGIRGAMRFVIESCSAYFVKFILCGLLNLALATLVPVLVPYLKWVGAAYMLYLAYGMLKAGWAQADDTAAAAEKKESYPSGIILQCFNVKSWVCALSVYSVYVVPYTRSVSDILLTAVIALAYSVVATMLWCVCGKALEGVYKKYRKTVGAVFALGLVYCAVTAVL